MKKLLTIITLSSLPFASFAFDFSDVAIWAGSGTNEAVFVIDFNANPSPSSYAWGYRWTGNKTAAEMLAEIDLVDPNLTVSTQLFGGSVFIQNVTYQSPTTSANYSGAPWPAGYFNYFTGVGAPPVWTSSSVGLSDVTLTNGSWQGLSWISAPNYTVTNPRTPVAAVPEPASIMALILGTAALIRRKSAKAEA